MMRGHRRVARRAWWLLAPLLLAMLALGAWVQTEVPATDPWPSTLETPATPEPR